MTDGLYCAAIVDLKGVMYEEHGRKADGSIDKRAREGAKQFLDFLVGEGVPHIFATNVTSETKECLVADMSNTGLLINPSRVVTCVDTCVAYLKKEKLSLVYIVAEDDNLKALFDNDKYFKLVRAYDPDAVVAHAVVVGLDRGLNPTSINGAINHVRKGARLVALHMNRIRSTHREGEVEGNVGGLATYIAYCGHTGATPVSIYDMGKPNREFYQYILSILRIPDEDRPRTLVIGDDPEADLRGGRDTGMPTAFFPSMKYKFWPQDMGFEPDVKIEKSLEALIPLFVVPHKA